MQEAWRGAEQSMAVIKAVSSKAGIGHAIDYVTKNKYKGKGAAEEEIRRL